MGAVVDVALFDEVRRIAHGAGGVVEQHLLLFGRHQAEQSTRLAEIVVIVFAVIPEIRIAGDFQRWFFELGLLLPLAKAVGLVVQCAAVVRIHAALTVAVIAVHRATRFVDRNLLIIHAQTVALRIGVVEQARLQHAVGRDADAGYQIAWRKGGLFDVEEEVFRIAVQLEFAHFNQRIITFRPDFGQVERVVRYFFRIGFGHNLHIHGPFREIAALNRIVQIALIAFTVFADNGFGFGIAQVFNALLGTEMEFHPETLIGRIDEAVRMRAKTVHVAIAFRNAAVGHHNRHLVQGFRQQCPEIPVVFGAAQIGAWVAFDGFVQIRKLARVAQKEHRCVVADHVPVAFFGVELQGKAADVALGIGRTAFTGHGGETGKHLGFLANLAKDFRTGVLGDVVGDGEGTERAGTFGVHAPLRNNFAHKVGELFVEPHILRQQGAAWAGCHAVLIVHDGGAEISGQVCDRAFLLILTHTGSPWDG